jgi:uncharacterized protein
MKLKGEVTVNAIQEEVWQLFMDPTQFCQVIPGCEQARRLDETHYEVVLSIKIQFMTIRSKAQGTLLEAEAPHHLVGELIGEPLSMAGAFRARLTFDLVQVGTATDVQYEMDLTMLGRLASLGEAIIRSTSKHLTAEIAENIAQYYNRPYTP